MCTQHATLMVSATHACNMLLQEVLSAVSFMAENKLECGRILFNLLRYLNAFYCWHKTITRTGTTGKGMKGICKCASLTGLSLTHSVKRRQDKFLVFFPWKCNFIYLLVYQRSKCFSLGLPFTNQKRVLSISVK